MKSRGEEMFQSATALLTNASFPVEKREHSYQFQEERGMNNIEFEENIQKSKLTDRRDDLMHSFEEDGTPVREESPQDYYLPTWQMNPAFKTSLVNENLLRRERAKNDAITVLNGGKITIGSFIIAPPGTPSDSNPTTARLGTLEAFFHSLEDGEEKTYLGDPMSNLYIPGKCVVTLPSRLQETV